MWLCIFPISCVDDLIIAIYLVKYLFISYIFYISQLHSPFNTINDTPMSVMPIKMCYGPSQTILVMSIFSHFVFKLGCWFCFNLWQCLKLACISNNFLILYIFIFVILLIAIEMDSYSGTYSLDQMSDDEDELRQQDTNRQPSQQLITASQLAAALSAATGSLSTVWVFSNLYTVETRYWTASQSKPSCNTDHFWSVPIFSQSHY